MRYVIMADGEMHRWHDAGGVPKHLQIVGKETLLQRIVRQVHAADPTAEILITSHNPVYEVAGATRYEPLNNHIEVDRFTWELIDDQVCFLYGDTFYTDDAIQQIVRVRDDKLHFVGNRDSIVAVKVFDASTMKKAVDEARELFLKGILRECKGWQVYQAFLGNPLGDVRIGNHFSVVSNETKNIDTVEEYRALLTELNQGGCHGLD